MAKVYVSSPKNDLLEYRARVLQIQDFRSEPQKRRN
jgi:hypothetical protein